MFKEVLDYISILKKISIEKDYQLNNKKKKPLKPIKIMKVRILKQTYIRIPNRILNQSGKSNSKVRLKILLNRKKLLSIMILSSSKPNLQSIYQKGRDNDFRILNFKIY